MSNAPYALKRARFGYRMGDGPLVDLMIWDGLRSTFDEKHMVQQAASVARELGVSREEQDGWALRSHERAVQAIDEAQTLLIVSAGTSIGSPAPTAAWRAGA